MNAYLFFFVFNIYMPVPVQAGFQRCKILKTASILNIFPFLPAQSEFGFSKPEL